MPRRLFKRYMPDPESIRSQKSLRFLGKLTHDPNLWHLNRHSVSRAMAAGLFAAFIPMPMQMLLAAGLAVWIRSNLPIRRIGLADQSDHDAPGLYCTYKLGAWLMQVPPRTCRTISPGNGSARSCPASGNPSCSVRWCAASSPPSSATR